MTAVTSPDVVDFGRLPGSQISRKNSFTHSHFQAGIVLLILMKPQDLKIAVIGGGPGGLCTAIALRRKGFQNVIVFERDRGSIFEIVSSNRPPYCRSSRQETGIFIHIIRAKRRPGIPSRTWFGEGYRAFRIQGGGISDHRRTYR